MSLAEDLQLLEQVLLHGLLAHVDVVLQQCQAIEYNLVHLLSRLNKQVIKGS